MATSLRCGAALCLALGALALPSRADAIIITYINSGADDGTVVVGFDNDSSGWTTSDLVQNGNAFSRADTAYGPLPPVGQLPSFDAQTDARSEFGTNLNCATCTGVRSAFGPFNPGLFSNEASGTALQATGVYTSHSYLYSAQAASTATAPWIIRIDPSPGETIGTPVTVTIDASLDGVLDVTGAASADAFWNVSTTSYGTVINGFVSQATPGTQPFADSGQLQFIIPLGSTFELLVEHDLNAAGSGAGASSRAAVDNSLVEISAAFGMPLIVANQLTADFPTAVDILWEENATQTRWIADCTIDGRRNRIFYDNDATLRRRIEWIDAAELPAPVLAAVALGWPGYELRNVRRFEVFRRRGTDIEYRVRLRASRYDIIVASFSPEGDLLDERVVASPEALIDGDTEDDGDE